MNMCIQAYYYISGNGKAPLERYFKKFKDKFAFVELVRHIDKLIETGGRLPYPYTKHVWKKVYELRFKTIIGQHRVFYFIHLKGKLILLDAYTKKTNKIPKNILKKIKKYYLDYLKNQHEAIYEKPSGILPGKNA